MEIQKIKISKIVHNTGQIDGLPANPRKKNDVLFDKLVKSIEEDPEMLELRELLVYPHGDKYVVIAGNMRLDAMKQLGFKDAPCKVISSETPVKKLKAYTIKDNASFGEWDVDLLVADWDVAQLEDWGVELPEDDIEVLEEQEVEEDDFDESEVVENIVQPLDVWKLGEHRLMCGDSTSENDFAILMDNQTADLSFTSPALYGGVMKVKGNDYTQKPKYNSYDDNKTSDDYLSFITSNVGLLLQYSKDVFYNIGLVEGNKREIIKLCMNYLDRFKDVIYWEKTSVAPHIQNGVINNLVEFILCFGDGHRKFQNAQFHQGTYWNVIKGNGASNNEYSKIHKATFPIYLPENIITNFCPKGGSVIDCFGGTGTTLIACEQLNRKCYMMELDPHYCDVIIARWEKLTGKKAEKIV